MSSSSYPPPPPMPERIVTGHTPDGRSTTVLIDRVKPVQIHSDLPSLIGRIWTASGVPTTLNDTIDEAKDHVPPRVNVVEPNGHHFCIVQSPPGASSPVHRTSSIDYVVLISGCLTLVMEDGTEVELSVPGTVCVQRGTLHQWQNRSEDWTQFIAVTIDANPVQVRDQGGKLRALREGRVN